MPSSKELNIIIQAQLEQGNVIENAKNLGLGISSAIEQAFQGLGERIAANLVLQMQGVISNVKFSDVFSNSTNSTAQLLHTAQYNTPLAGNWSRSPGGIYLNQQQAQFVDTPGGTPVGSTVHSTVSGAHAGASNAAMAAAAATSYDYSGRFLRGNFGFGIQDRAFMGISTNLGPNFSNERIAEMERTREDLRLYNTMRKIDPSYQMEPELRERAGRVLVSSKELSSQQGQELKDINQTISALKSAFADITQSIRAYDAAQKAVANNTASAAQKELVQQGVSVNYKVGENGKIEQTNVQAVPLNEAKRLAAETVAAIDVSQTQKTAADNTLESAKQYQEDAGRAGIRTGPSGRFGRFVQGAKDFGAKYGPGVAMVAGAAAAYHGIRQEFENYYPAQEAARYRFENRGAFTALNADYGEAMAVQSLGGEAALREKAAAAAEHVTSGRFYSGVAKFAGGAAAAGGSLFTGPGAVVGVPVGIGFMGSGAHEIVKSMIDADDNYQIREEEAQKKIDIQKKRLALFNTVGDATRSRIIGSMNTAQAMGDVNLTQALYGAASASANTIKRPASNFGYDMPGNPGVTVEKYFKDHRNDYESLDEWMVARATANNLAKAKFDQKNQEIERQTYNFGQNSFLARATSKDIGLSSEQFDAFNRQMVLNIGGRGAFDDQRLADPYIRSMKMYSRGFYNAADVTSAYYNDNLNTYKGLRSPYKDEVYDPVQDSINALTNSAQLYSDIVASGVDVKDAAGLAGFASGRASARGAGHLYAEEQNLRTVLGTSRAMYGEDGINSRNVQENARKYANLQDYFKSDDAFSTRVGLRRMDEVNKLALTGKGKDGKDMTFDFNKYDEILFRRLDHDPESIRKFVKDKKGVDISPELAKQISDTHRDTTNKVAMDQMVGVPDQYRADLLATAAGSTSFSQMQNYAEFAQTQTPGIGDKLPKGKEVVGPPISAMASQAGDAKAADEAGKTKAVTEGFEALTSQTASLVGKMRDLAAAIDGLSNLRGSDGSYLMNNMPSPFSGSNPGPWSPDQWKKIMGGNISVGDGPAPPASPATPGGK